MMLSPRPNVTVAPEVRQGPRGKTMSFLAQILAHGAGTTIASEEERLCTRQTSNPVNVFPVNVFKENPARPASEDHDDDAMLALVDSSEFADPATERLRYESLCCCSWRQRLIACLSDFAGAASSLIDEIVRQCAG